MTTIAWDGTTLAADTLAISSGLKRRTSKLRVTERFLYGMTGYESEGIAIAAWLAMGADPAKPPPVDDDGAKGIVVERATGHVFAVSGKSCSLLRIREPFIADGSGRDFAIAAMALGKNSEEAVELSSLYDVGTSGLIELATIEDGMVRAIDRLDSTKR